jgi:hypothetical protein
MTDDEIDRRVRETRDAFRRDTPSARCECAECVNMRVLLAALDRAERERDDARYQLAELEAASERDVSRAPRDEAKDLRVAMAVTRRATWEEAIAVCDQTADKWTLMGRGQGAADCASALRAIRDRGATGE